MGVIRVSYWRVIITFFDNISLPLPSLPSLPLDNVSLPCSDRIAGAEACAPQGRGHICNKHHKQRLCKIIITRVKVHFVDVFRSN